MNGRGRAADARPLLAGELRTFLDSRLQMMQHVRALCGERIMTRSIEHIQEAARELADLATSEGETFLAHLLQMAADGAEHRNASSIADVSRGSLLDNRHTSI